MTHKRKSVSFLIFTVWKKKKKVTFFPYKEHIVGQAGKSLHKLRPKQKLEIRNLEISGRPW